MQTKVHASSVWHILAIGACLATGVMAATDQYWNPTTAASGAGSNIWAAGVNAWANTAAGTNAPVVWVDGNNANFTLNTGVNTVVVNGASASLLYCSQGTHVFLPGTGPLTIGAGGMTLGVAATVGCPIVAATDQVWTATASPLINGRVTGAPITIRTASGSSLWMTNAANAFNGLTVAIPSPAAAAGYANLGAGCAVSNTVTLGMPGGNLFSPAWVTIYGFGNNTSQFGNVSVASPAVLALVPTGATNTLAAGTLSRVGRATLVVDPKGGLGTQSFLTFTGGIVTSNGLVAPWMVSNDRQFLSYGGTGLANANYATAFSANTATQTVAISTATMLTAPAAAQALKLTGGALNLSGQPLSVGDGTYAGLLLASSIINTGVTAALDFGASEALIAEVGTDTGVIGVPILGTAGLTKFGAGTLMISNAAICASDILLSGGTTASGSLNLYPTTDAVYSNSIMGVGTVIKSGPNKLTLSGTNAFNLAGSSIAGGGTLLFSGGSFSNPVVNAALTLFTAPGSMLIVSNGARICQPGCNEIQSNSTVIVTGTNSVWDMLAHGQNSANFGVLGASNRLIVANGGVLTNATGFSFGNGNPYFGLSITNGGQLVMVRNDARYVGSYLGTYSISGRQPDTGQPSLWNFAGGGISFGDGDASVGSKGFSNLMTAANGAVLTNGTVTISTRGGYANTLVVTNGATAAVSLTYNGPWSGCWIGGSESDASVTSRVIASTIYFNASSNSLVVAKGGFLTNATIYVSGQYLGYSGNSVTITNGGIMFGSGGVGYSGNQAGNCISNRVVVTGSGSLWNGNGTANSIYIGNHTSWAGSTTLVNAVQLDAGGMLTNIGTLYVGFGSAAASAISNQLAISGNGGVYASTITVGTIATNSGNNVALSSGGLLEAGTLTISTPGNFIANNGGIYQFSTITPTITPNGAG